MYAKSTRRSVTMYNNMYINTVRSLNKRYNVITSTMLGNIVLLTFKFSCIIS